jgi:hypothetical protein
VKDVWCISGFDRQGRFFLTHIVATSPIGPVEREGHPRHPEKFRKKTGFVLHHTREDEDGYENVKLIGVYSSKERAERVVESYRGLPGFAEYPEGFSISAYEIDKDHWTEGFVDLSNS